MVYSCLETVGGSTSANLGLMYAFHGRLHIQRHPEAPERSPGHDSIADDYNLKVYDGQSYLMSTNHVSITAIHPVRWPSGLRR